MIQAFSRLFDNGILLLERVRDGASLESNREDLYVICLCRRSNPDLMRGSPTCYHQDNLIKCIWKMINLFIRF